MTILIRDASAGQVVRVATRLAPRAFSGEEIDTSDRAIAQSILEAVMSENGESFSLALR